MRGDTETETEDILGCGAAGRVNAGYGVGERRSGVVRGSVGGIRQGAATVPVWHELLLATRRGGDPRRMSGDVLDNVMPAAGGGVWHMSQAARQPGLSRGTCAVDTALSILRAKEPGSKGK